MENAKQPTEILPPVRSRRRARVTTPQQWELVRADLTPMYLERRTVADIAEHFSVCENTARAWRNRLANELREDASLLQPLDYATDSMTSIGTARTEAWRIYRESDDTQSQRAALYVVLSVENQSHKLGELIGFYGRADVMKNRERRNEGVSELHDMMEEFFNSSPLDYLKGVSHGQFTDERPEEDPGSEKPPRAPVVSTGKADDEDDALDHEPWDDDYFSKSADQHRHSKPAVPWSMA
ncbi:helix-turn-helix domain-containing protein [Ruegeria sp. R14_0]|uniref:helix-turn-helix domain-containing protein n=1 Tax=Ruegeria sp. R14_0 TaxID=2821100 RepID=UPI001ADAFC60|nr:helix-turn-helix domain-containing protein [Ruegeria sp. R14_0]MBO9445730.1 hypothetical protein [Ruegeria sp. R14_0]